MRAIIRRLHRLENTHAPHSQARADAEAILEARRRRYGASYGVPGAVSSRKLCGLSN